MERHSLTSLLVIYAVVVCCFVWSGYVGKTQAVSVAKDLTLSREEKLALDKFKSKVLPILPHAYMRQDIYLIRWLRARDYNVQDAEVMLRNNLRWRREQKIDHIVHEDWSDLLDDYPYTNDTFDKTGRPLATFNLGAWDIRAMALAGKMPRLVRYLNKMFDEGNHRVLREQAKGKAVTQWSAIINLDGFNEYQHACPLCLPALSSLVNNYEDYFPGMAHKIMQINAPPLYQIVLNIIRPILSPITRETFVVMGPNKKEWMAYLDKQIDKSQTTSEFGGTRVLEK